MNAVAKNKATSRRISGFSNRLNEILDAGGYPPVEKGRANRLANRTGYSRVQTGKWIRDDLVPNNLEELVEILLEDMGSFASISSTVKWLKEGDKNYDPTVLHSHKGMDYTLLAKAIVYVRDVASEQGIDIEQLSDQKLDLICNAVIRRAGRSRKSEIDKTIIIDLLQSVNLD